jgi:putative NIF3 family GTP cyclohydrolase 1 type 2
VGEGGFKPLEGSKPFVGTNGTRHTAEETQLHMIFPKHLHSKVIKALLEAHPYETVAYEITTLENSRSDLGMGCIGDLSTGKQESDFLKELKAILGTPVLRHSALLGKHIKRVAILGGSGSFAIESAMAQGADAYITADLKYHDFFRAEASCLLVDVGHYESEQFTKTTIMEHLNKNFPNFAFISSKTDTNPVHYF